MIEVHDKAPERVMLVVRPNRSMTWKANLWLAASLSAVCFGMAVLLATQGLWMVLPFAGLESIAVVVCLWLTQRRLYRQEVITIDQQSIWLEWGYEKPDETVQLPRHWSRLAFQPPRNAFENGELSVVLHAQHYNIGRGLNREEKAKLHHALKQALQRIERLPEKAASQDITLLPARHS